LFGNGQRLDDKASVLFTELRHGLVFFGLEVDQEGEVLINDTDRIPHRLHLGGGQWWHSHG